MSAAEVEAICSVADCDRDAHTRGLCRLHYTRVLRTGTTTKAAGFPELTKAKKGRRLQNAIPFTIDTGTVTLEQWKRLRAEPAADVHIVQGQSIGGFE